MRHVLHPTWGLHKNKVLPEHCLTWTNAPLGCSDLLSRSRQLCLPQAINLLVEIKQEVRPVRDEQPSIDLDAPASTRNLKLSSL